VRRQWGNQKLTHKFVTLDNLDGYFTLSAILHRRVYSPEVWLSQGNHPVRQLFVAVFTGRQR